MSDNIVYKGKIPTVTGVYEFEGDKEFVEKRLDQVFKMIQEFDSYATKPAPRVSNDDSHHRQEKKPESSRPAKKVSLIQPQQLPGLFSDSTMIQSLKGFIASKSPQNNREFFVCIAYWMKENLKLNEISIDEIWTAYKVLSQKPPRVLVQVFRDSKSEKGWYSSGSTVGKYSISSIGETFVEHDLPAQ